jgi:hypothetical protein
MRRFDSEVADRLGRSSYTRRAMREERHDDADERAEGLAMLGTILFCVVVGGGVGIFAEQPVIGAIAGGLFGIVLGLWLVPRLLRDWD